MYDPDKSLRAASTQDLWTTLLLKRRFNEFDLVPIVQDLYAQPHLWQKVWLGWLVFEASFIKRRYKCRSPDCLISSWRLKPIASTKNDVLYIQSADDEYVPVLLEWAKRWQADDVQVFDRDRMARILGRLTRLIDELGQEQMQGQINQWKAKAVCAPVLALWWD